MGTLAGHVVPGTFFALFAVWWIYSIFHRYFLTKRFRVHGSCYQNTLTFPCPCCPYVPMEGILKLVAIGLGISGELATGFEHGRWEHMGNAQHITMFFFFCFASIMDIMLFYEFQLPPDVDYVAAVLAFSIEAFIFAHHLDGRSSMDQQVHMFLFYAVVASAVSTAVEMKYKKNVLPALSRAFCTLLQGTWFYQIGFILYPPSGEQWNQEDHEQKMLVTVIFSWHIAFIFVLFLIFGSLVWQKVKRMDSPGTYQMLTLKTLIPQEHARVKKDNFLQESRTVIDSDSEEV